MSPSKRLVAGVGSTVVLATCVTGCLIDDTSGTRGQAAAPAASVPDSGSPVRRESPAKTLRDADAERRRTGDGGAELNVDPAPGETPASPPAQ